MATAAPEKTDGLNEYLTLMQQFRALTPRQEEECLALIHAGDSRSQRHLVESYLPRIVSWVAPMRGGSMSFEKLIQAGNQTLLSTLEKVNDAKNLEAELKQAILANLDFVLQRK